MSIEALAWALNLAPVPVDKNGKPSSACAAVLQGLANHADADGIGAFPSVATLVRYTRLSERTVQASLSRLAESRIIRPCSPEIIAARIRRADRRPRGWDLDLTLVRDDLTDEDITNLERQFPGLRNRIEEAHSGAQTPVCATGDEVQPSHPASSDPVDNSSDEVQRLHLVEGTGCSQYTNGVQLTHSRGAAAAPEPSIEPPSEPPAAYSRARARNPEPVKNPAGGGDPGIDEFFGRLGSAWPLSPAQRTRLRPAVTVALGLGWQPGDLAAYVGANTVGVRNPAAVLAVRLSPSELPVPASPSPADRRKPWCGQCDERTRLLEDDFNEIGVHQKMRRCPRCGPGSGLGRQGPVAGQSKGRAL